MLQTDFYREKKTVTLKAFCLITRALPRSSPAYYLQHCPQGLNILLHKWNLLCNSTARGGWWMDLRLQDKFGPSNGIYVQSYFPASCWDHEGNQIDISKSLCFVVEGRSRNSGNEVHPPLLLRAAWASSPLDWWWWCVARVAVSSPWLIKGRTRPICHIVLTAVIERGDPRSWGLHRHSWSYDPELVCFCRSSPRSRQFRGSFCSMVQTR